MSGVLQRDGLGGGVSEVNNIVIAEEKWATLWAESEPMMKAHEVEVGQADPRAPLDPPHELINAIEPTGAILILAARHTGVLVGYFIWYIARSLESSKITVASAGPWYVVPGWRSAGVGLMLWRESKKHLKAKGVSQIYAHYPEEGAGSQLGPFFAREGAKNVGRRVMMWIGD